MFLWINFHTLPYLEMRTDHVNNTPTLLTIVNTMSILFFWSYGYIFTNLPYLEMRTDHVNTTPTLSITVYIMSILFLPFFPWFSSYVCINCHIRKCTQTTWTVHQHCQQQCLSVYSFYLFSPDFVTIFVLITIFGNAHRPCKHYSSIVHNSLHHVYSFFFFFLIFWLYLHYLPYLEMCTDHVKSTPIFSTTVYIMSVLFFSFFPLIFWLYLRRLLYQEMRTDHVNSSATSPHHPYFFLIFFPIFFIWNYKIYHIWQFLVFILVTGFHCHSVLVNSRDCSGEITGILKFHSRSEILAGKFHWNGTGIHQNDRNPAGICGASLRPLDFIAFATLVGITLVWIIITYDIICQWSKNFWKNMSKFPAAMQIPDTTEVGVAAMGWIAERASTWATWKVLGGWLVKTSKRHGSHGCRNMPT